MSFGATLTLTVNAVAKVLNRTDPGLPFASQYSLFAALEEYVVNIRHTRITRDGKPYDRHNIEVVHTVYATVSAAEIVRRCYTVLENSRNDDKTAVGYLIDAFVNYVDSATVQGDLINWLS